MAEEHHQVAIVTIFDLEEIILDRERALFRQRIPVESQAPFHYWSMDIVDWDALDRPTSFQMTITAYDAPEPLVETVTEVKEVVAADAIKEMVVEAVQEAVEMMDPVASDLTSN